MVHDVIDAGKRCVCTLAWCMALACVFASSLAGAQTLASKAKESGCTDAPRPVDGSMFRCSTTSGAQAYFNVPGAENYPPSRTNSPPAKSTPSPSGFPRVDSDTQRSRDDMRRKVLSEELSAEEKLLVEARATYANGAPVPLPEETSNANKYRDRIARLRQSMQLHERNIEALRKELSATK